MLDQGSLTTRDYSDSCWKPILKKDKIKLEACFEKKLPPPERLLLWMIEHSERLTWPLKSRRPPVERRYTGNNGENQVWRERLKARHGPEAMDLVRVEGRRLLTNLGTRGSEGEWWAFEGYTHIDCYLETETLLLIIEGKCTESLSTGVSWFPQRNQLWRNLEVAANWARGKPFALLLIAENEELIEDATASLPHLGDYERAFLRAHFLGCVTWQQACQATGINYSLLPETIDQAQP